MPIGYQDQYAAAYGGLNYYRFESGGATVEPVRMPPESLARLQRNLLLFFTGSSRESSRILSRQRDSTERDEGAVLAALHAVRQMADEMKAVLEAGDVDGFGGLLARGWEQKKRFAAGVSNPEIDAAYDLARAHGALGGKIAGAGGGGFMMLYCPESTHAGVTGALEARGLRRMDFRFEQGGARVLLNTGLRLDQESVAPGAVEAVLHGAGGGT
ncbi:MAG: hypothetical protein HY784_08630 [Chloroflexi bacterium]|nr:hypothetical protein [Chloroflexota bacterium]